MILQIPLPSHAVEKTSTSATRHSSRFVFVEGYYWPVFCRLSLHGAHPWLAVHASLAEAPPYMHAVVQSCFAARMAGGLSALDGHGSPRALVSTAAASGSAAQPWSFEACTHQRGSAHRQRKGAWTKGSVLFHSHRAKRPYSSCARAMSCTSPSAHTQLPFHRYAHHTMPWPAARGNPVPLAGQI